MIISKVLGDCPKCAKTNSFGICIVRKQQVLKGCRHCNYQHWQKLPSLKKQVLYLDQCFLSKMFRRTDKQVGEAGRIIGRLAHWQQVVCPFSCIHETESLQWISDKRDELFQFIKETSRGRRFKLESEVKMIQMDRSLRHYLSQETTSVDLQPFDALPKDVDDWDDRIWIDMKFSLENPEATRKLKAFYADQLIALFPRWREMKLSYKELLKEETEDAARMLWTLLADSVRRHLSLDPTSFMSGSQAGEMMLQLFAVVQRENDAGNALQILDQYLKSSQFTAVPHIAISAALNAKLRQRVQQGYYGNAEAAKDTLMGHPYDVEFISVFGPYCDAMFLDNTMRQWLNENDFDFERQYGVRLYSKSNIEEFLDWLLELESTVPEDVEAAANEIYL